MFSFIFTMFLEGIILAAVGLVFCGIVFYHYRTNKLGDQYTSVFKLDPSAVNHNGEAIPDNTLFFANPPKEIGRLISANAALKKDQSVIEPFDKFLCNVGILFITVGTFFISAQWTSSLEIILRVLGIFIPTMFVFWISFPVKDPVISSANLESSFVGEKGFAEHTGRFANKKIHAAITLKCLFKDYDYLYENNTHKYNQGAYAGLHYKYIRAGKNGKETVMNGISSAAKKEISLEKDERISFRYYFAQSCKNAWAQYVIKAAEDLYIKDRDLMFESYKTVKPSSELNLDPDISISRQNINIVFRTPVLKLSKYVAEEKKVQINSAHIKKIGIKNDEYFYLHNNKRYHGEKPNTVVKDQIKLWRKYQGGQLFCTASV